MSTGTRILTGNESCLYIGGRWVHSSDGRLAEVINPTTEESIGEAALAGPADIDHAVRAARAAFDTGPWASSTPAERAEIMTKAAELMSERAELFARTITLEVGSPFAIANWQPLAAKLYLEWYAARAATFAWEEERDGIRSRLLVRRQPVGVVGAIVPWNFPLALSFPKFAPGAVDRLLGRAQAARGDAAVRLLLAEVFEEAGLPPGVLNVMPADRTVSEELVEHPLVDKISFTGSTAPVERIAALCGEQIKRCSLELGGKSAAIVLPDADLDAVIPAAGCPNTIATTARPAPTRRACSPTASAVRRDRRGLREAIGARDRRSRRIRTVHRARWSALPARPGRGLHRAPAAKRARACARRRPPERPDRGYFVEPTIFADVDNSMTIAQEEIFGPVADGDPLRRRGRMRSRSPTTRGTGCRAASGGRTPSTPRTSPGGSAAATSRSTSTRWIRRGRSAASSNPGLGRENGLEGIGAYIELQCIPYVS